MELFYKVLQDKRFRVFDYISPHLKNIIKVMNKFSRYYLFYYDFGKSYLPF